MRLTLMAKQLKARCVARQVYRSYEGVLVVHEGTEQVYKESSCTIREKEADSLSDALLLAHQYITSKRLT